MSYEIFLTDFCGEPRWHVISVRYTDRLWSTERHVYTDSIHYNEEEVNERAAELNGDM